MTDDEYHEIGTDLLDRIRGFGNAPFVHPDSRREFRGALEEIEWCIEDAEELSVATVRQRIPVWEKSLNKVLGQMDNFSEVDISVDDDRNVIFTAKE